MAKLILHHAAAKAGGKQRVKFASFVCSSHFSSAPPARECRLKIKGVNAISDEAPNFIWSAYFHTIINYIKGV